MPAAKVRELLDYNSETGVFTWLRRPIRSGAELADKGWNTRFEGKRAAGRPHRHGHLYLNIAFPVWNSKNYAAHRVAWAHYYGEWPPTTLDHVNGNPTDNRIANLRLATGSQNQRNQKRRTDNTSGHKGVSWSNATGKWYAYINVDGRMRSLGRYVDKEAAIAARRAAATKFFGEFAREHG